jgi:hypothetical protein
MQPLSLLLSLSKSSINSKFAALGYVSSSLTSVDNDQLLEMCPYLQLSPSELRKWTIRRKNQMSAGYRVQLMESPAESKTDEELFDEWNDWSFQAEEM